MDFQHYQQLKNQGVISKGMVPKLDNSFDAIENGVEKVVICHSEDVLKAAQNSELGTVLSK